MIESVQCKIPRSYVEEMPLPLPGCIHYFKQGANEYANYEPDSFSVDGHNYHHQFYLGKVLDKENGLFYSRSEGFINFSMEHGIVQRNDLTLIGKSTSLHLNFGDVWLYNEILRQSGFGDVIKSLIPRRSDTLNSLLIFRLSENAPFYYAQRWYDKSYAKLQYPNAAVSSHSISTFLEDLGSEYNYRQFTSKYLEFLTKNTEFNDMASFAVILDSTILPNDSKMHKTKVSTHGGDTENGSRLIYVVDKDSGLPIYFKLISGNTLDDSTLLTTIALLKANNIDPKFMILDAGYSSLKNLDSFDDFTIPYITRLKPNLVLYKLIIDKFSLNVFSDAKNIIQYNDRYLFCKKILVVKHVDNGKVKYILDDETPENVELDLTQEYFNEKDDDIIPDKLESNDTKDVIKDGKNCKRYFNAYLCIDIGNISRDLIKICQSYTIEDKFNSDNELDIMKINIVSSKINDAGRFILVSNSDIEAEKIVETYYTRQKIEQIFDISKNNASLVPLRVHSEENLRGHIMLSFLITIITLIISKRIQNYKLCPFSIFFTMKYLSINIFPDINIIEEPTKDENDIISILDLQSPFLIDKREHIDNKLKKVKSKRGRKKGQLGKPLEYGQASDDNKPENDAQKSSRESLWPPIITEPQEKPSEKYKKGTLHEAENTSDNITGSQKRPVGRPKGSTKGSNTSGNLTGSQVKRPRGRPKGSTKGSNTSGNLTGSQVKRPGRPKGSMKGSNTSGNLTGSQVKRPGSPKGSTKFKSASSKRPNLQESH
jgi:hypothetical protein